VIVDTDVMIWYMRGNEKARAVIDGYNGFFVSAVTYMELIQGMKNKKELMALRKAFRIWNAKILYLNEDITARAMFYVEQHFLSNSVELADALIGATAVVNGMPLLTGNVKHYKALKDVQLQRFVP
jgi:predicted nucleic acid-binding protein